VSDPSASAAVARPPQLPAVRIDRGGRRRVDYRAVLALAAPLVLNASAQAALNLVDTWFIGRLSTAATAAMGASYFLVLVFVLFFGGVGMAVQTLVAQAYGSRRRRRAARAVWTGTWAALATVPVFWLLALSGAFLFAPFGLPTEVEPLALEYWLPRMVGGPVAVAIWAVTGFFNGIGRTTVTLWLNVFVVVLNAALNEVFMFRLGMGIAGAGWATTAAVAAGWLVAVALFLGASVNREYASRLTWPFRRRPFARLVGLGIPMGLSVTMDLAALSVFQLMQVRIGAIDGAASQLALMVTSICYMPAVGIGIAGTTLVGQSIGAGDRDWARKVGNATIKLAVGYMGIVGVLLAAAGPWLLPLFVSATDPNAAAVVALGATLLWLAAAYQAFDGLNIGASFCLRGAGDARVPALVVLGLAWGLFLPLAHIMTFAPGQGWISALPALGWGATGGWIAAVIYCFALGTSLALRWRSGAWRRITLH
jgi:MATE family multidrug resistance protein